MAGKRLEKLKALFKSQPLSIFSPGSSIPSGPSSASSSASFMTFDSCESIVDHPSVEAQSARHSHMTIQTPTRQTGFETSGFSFLHLLTAGHRASVLRGSADNEVVDIIREDLVAMAQALSLISMPDFLQLPPNIVARVMKHVYKYGKRLLKVCSLLRDIEKSKETLGLRNASCRIVSLLAQEHMVRATEIFEFWLFEYQELHRMYQTTNVSSSLVTVFQSDAAAELPPDFEDRIQTCRVYLGCALVDILASSVMYMRPASLQEQNLYNSSNIHMSKRITEEMQTPEQLLVKQNSAPTVPIPSSNNSPIRSTGKHSNSSESFKELKDNEMLEAKIRAQAATILNTSVRLIETINQLASDLSKLYSPDGEIYNQVCTVTSTLWRAVVEVVVPYTIAQPVQDGENTFERRVLEPSYLSVSRAISKIFEGPDLYIFQAYSIELRSHPRLTVVGSGPSPLQGRLPESPASSSKSSAASPQRFSCELHNINLDVESDGSESGSGDVLSKTSADEDEENTRQEQDQHAISKATPPSVAEREISQPLASPNPRPTERKKSIAPARLDIIGNYRKSTRYDITAEEKKERSGSVYRRQVCRSVALTGQKGALLLSDLLPDKSDVSRFRLEGHPRKTVRLTLEEKQLIEDEKMGTNVPYWEESESDIYTYYYEDESTMHTRRKILAGSINKLIHQLTHEEFVFAVFRLVFLTTFPTFITPSRFLKKLSERFDVPDPPKSLYIDEEEFRTTTRLPIQKAVLDVVRQWISMPSFDITAETLPVLFAFLGKANQVDIDHREIVSEIMQLVEKKTTHIGFSKNETSPEPPRTPIRASQDFSFNQVAHNYAPELIADQWTVIIHRIYKKIQPHEFLHQSWNDSEMQSRCPNLSKMIQKFNCISSWVAMCIVGCNRLKDRITVYCKFVRLAECLYERNNFDGMFAVTSGILSSAIHRLKHTRGGVPESVQKSLTRLSTLISPYASYKDYRRAVESSSPPIIPYV
eukprot:TRINITY_DN3264_c0_g4_i2.p1 TRINITY_DN3264_c0_g4~~TRINITY_DN3264_c0_g4_i2.p1  ORF type:complete len:988 (-),score=164.23 TRINITY_DN3264_c0_g4_i2:915-3878(-)